MAVYQRSPLSRCMTVDDEASQNEQDQHNIPEVIILNTPPLPVRARRARRGVNEVVAYLKEKLAALLQRRRVRAELESMRRDLNERIQLRPSTLSIDLQQASTAQLQESADTQRAQTTDPGVSADKHETEPREPSPDVLGEPDEQPNLEQSTSTAQMLNETAALSPPQGPRVPQGYRIVGHLIDSPSINVHPSTGEVEDSQARNNTDESESAAPQNHSGGVRPISGEPITQPPHITSSPPTMPSVPLAISLDQMSWLVERLMRRDLDDDAPELGLGLPQDHIGKLDEFDDVWVEGRRIAEKMRNEMQGQLLTGVMVSRKALQKVKHNGDCNLIHHLAPISRGQTARVMDVGAGFGYWAKSVSHAHTDKTTVFGADAYHKMEGNTLIKNSMKVIIDLDEEWDYLPQQLKLIRIGDCIVHSNDKAELFRRCHDALLPGGFLELQFLEPIVRNNWDGDVATENPLNMFFKLLCRDVPDDLRMVSGSAMAKVALQEAGFEDEDIEISRSRAFIGPYTGGNTYDRVAATLCREALLRYERHVEDHHFIVGRGLMRRELEALREHVWEMLDSQTCRFHLRFVCIVARRA